MLEKTEIERPLEMDVIELTQKEWSSPIDFEPKKDGSLKLWVYYQKLNAVTVRDYYPIQRMDECID